MHKHCKDHNSKQVEETLVKEIQMQEIDKHDSNVQVDPVDSCPVERHESIVRDPIVEESDNNESNKATESESKEEKSKWQRVMYWNTWLQRQPWDTGNEKVAALVIYFLFVGLACIPIIDILTYDSSYTDVMLKYHNDSPVWLPDSIVCPPRNECAQCKSPFNQYDYIYDVWWNNEMLEYLNITEVHLNLLASIIHKRAFGKKVGIPKVLMQYLHKATAKVQAGYNITYDNNGAFAYQIPLNQKFQFTTKSFLTLEHLWYLLVKFPKPSAYYIQYHTIMRNRSLYPNPTRYLNPEVGWVNNAYCLIYRNNDRYAWGGIPSMSMTAWLMTLHPSRHWFGNLTVDFLHISYFTSSELGLRQEVEILTFKGFQRKSKCQKSLSLHVSENCVEQNMNNYSWIVIHAPIHTWPSRHLGLAINNLQFTMPSRHIVKIKVYSTLSTIEIVMNMFCLFLGFSLFQVISVMNTFLSRWMNFFKNTYYKITVVILVILCALVLFSYDVALLFEGKYVQKIAYGNTKLPMPSFRMSSALNFKKLKQFNISLGLLQYISIASTSQQLEILDSKNIYVDPVDHIADSLKFIPNPLHTDNLILNDVEKQKLLTRGSCFGMLSKLYDEYLMLAKDLGFDPSVPAYTLFEALHIDKCKIIVTCKFNGELLENCCNYFNYSLMPIHNRWYKDYPKLLLTLNNSMRHFLFSTNNDEADIRIEFNFSSISTLNDIAEYAKMHGNLSNTVTKHVNLAEIRPTQFGSFEQNKGQFMSWGIPGQTVNPDVYYTGGAPIVVGHNIRISTIRYARKEALFDRENIMRCTTNRECHETLFVEGGLIKQIYIYLSCGCMVCHSGQNPILSRESKCCSPERAVHCLANPKLYATNYFDFINCTEKDMSCVYENKQYNACPATSENILLDKTVSWHRLYAQYTVSTRPYGLRYLNTTTWLDKRYYRFDYPSHPASDIANYSARIRHVLDDILKCVHDRDISSNGPPELCSDRDYQTVEIAIRQPPDKAHTTIEYKLDETSIVDDFTESRDSRQYSMLEAFGIFLGGVGFFLGIDILSLVESIMKYYDSKQEQSRIKRFKQSLTPVHLHLMRMFANLTDETKLLSETEAELHNDPTQAESAGTAKKRAMFICLLGIGLFVSGIALSIYAGTTDLLSVTEYNLEMSNQTLSSDLPAFAFCEIARVGQERNFIKAQITAFLKNIGARCWVGMVEQSCLSLFEIYLFTGRHHCWVMSGKLGENVKVLGPLIKPNEYSFVFASNITASFDHGIWLGDLKDILNGKISLRTWTSYKSRRSTGENKQAYAIVLNYYEIRNISASYKPTDICSTCTDTATSTCCISLFTKYQEKGVDNYLAADTNLDFGLHRIYKAPLIEINTIYRIFHTSTIWRENKNSNLRYVALKRSTPYVPIFREIPRHSMGAKFSMVSGYLDLLLGLSLVSFGGVVFLFIWRKLVSAILKAMGSNQVEPAEMNMQGSSDL